MRSKVADAVSREQRERLAALTPAARVARAIAMSDEGLCAYMARHGVDRRTARARIAVTRRAGRRCSPADEQR